MVSADAQTYPDRLGHDRQKRSDIYEPQKEREESLGAGGFA